ncbi:MAG: indolepyruvate ferredoxin oxidoreductase, beta subunit [Bradyrhizobium sp.]|jgi:indolepyruvate ferredoxin oxidoreductase beta subunit
MNVSVAPISVGLSQARPISVAVLAMGGQGGGVLVDWIVALAERRGWYAQSTSVPGVAQRTGATIYYIEMIAPDAGRPDRHPVLSLMPAPGKVDIVIGAELMEAGRAILRGLVSPDRTLLIGSSHRSLAVIEKTAPGDGTADASQVYDAANVAANRFIAFDMAEIADATGSAVSAVLFGALAGAAALPFTTEDFEATIRAAGVGVDGSLRAFTAGRERAVTELKRDPKIKPAPKPPLGKRYPKLVPIGNPDYDALVARARHLPAELHGIVAAGLQRVVDFQDVGYGQDYLTRLEAMPRDATGLQQAFAKYLAIAMAYDDVIRVADLKTRAGRFDRVRREARAGDEQVLAITEFFHPRIEEMAGLLPPRLGEKLERSARLARLIDRGRKLRTTAPSSFLLLYCVAGLRRFRRGTLRYAREMRHLDDWAQRIRKFAAQDVALATAVCEARRLVGGYSDTHSRGETKFDKVMRVADRLAGRRDAAEWVQRLTKVALKDAEGTELDGALRTVETLFEDA